jgi:hypothetical protein
VGRACGEALDHCFFAAERVCFGAAFLNLALAHPELVLEHQAFFDHEDFFDDRDDQGVALVAMGRGLFDEPFDGDALDGNLLARQRFVDGLLLGVDDLADADAAGLYGLFVDGVLFVNDRDDRGGGERIDLICCDCNGEVVGAGFVEDVFRNAQNAAVFEGDLDVAVGVGGDGRVNRSVDAAGAGQFYVFRLLPAVVVGGEGRTGG